MPILAMSSGTVTAVWGQAFLRLPDGQLRSVKVGDKVAGGAQIVTADDGLVQIAPAVRPEAVAAQPNEATGPAEAVAANLDNLDNLEAPAAGLLAGLGGALSPGLRVDRVAESVTPQAFVFGTDRALPPTLAPVTALQPSAVAQAPTPTPTPPVAEDPPSLSVAAGPTVVEGSPAVFTLSLSHASGTPVSVALRLLDGLVDPVTGRNERITPGVDSTPLEVLNPLTGQWEPLSGSLVFAPGTTSLQVRVPTVNDRLVEGDETVALQARVDGGSVSGGTGPFLAEVLVRDNDAETTFFEATLAGRTTPMPTAVSGSLNFTDAEGRPVPAQLTAPTEALTSVAGQPVVWSSDGQGGLLGRGGSAPDAPLVASVRLLPDGGYSVALHNALKHADGSQVLDLHFGVQPQEAAAGARGGLGTGTLTVHVADDQPHLPAVADVHMTTLGTNLLVVLDTSNSMNATSGLPGLTRLQAAVQAIQQLIDRHDQSGEVAVRLVTFSDTGLAHGDHWLSAAEAKALLGTLSVSGSGYTNYDDALSVARAAFGTEAGRLADAQNVSCFLSDGNPTLSSDFPTPGLVTFTDASGQTVQAIQNGTTQPLLGDGLSASETASWTAFLAAHQIQSHAIGIGTEVSATHLDPIAHDGLTRSDTASAVFSVLDGLPGALLLGAASEVVSGRLLTTLASAGGQVGADGLGQVTRITIDGVTHDHFDTASPVQTFTTAAGGVFSIDVLTSAYSYRAPSGQAGTLQDEVGFTLVDRDGDPASAALRFSLAPIQVQVGTSGDDLLHGGAGVDVFAWHLRDAGTAGAPAVDHVTGFGVAAPSQGGDALDLRDLLQGEHGSAGSFNLDHCLHIGSESGSTVIRVSTAGDFSASDAGAGTETQRIVLDGIDLLASVGAGLSEHQFIARLVEQGKLLVDA